MKKTRIGFILSMAEKRSRRKTRLEIPLHLVTLNGLINTGNLLTKIFINFTNEISI